MGDGTLGFTLLDMIDHWAFGYGLLIAGLVECVLIGWIFGAGRLADSINASSKFRLGKGFITYIRFVLPLILGAVIVMAVYKEIQGSWLDEDATGLYGAALDASYKPDLRGWLSVLPHVTFGFWVLGPIVGSYFLTRAKGKEESLG
jgi:NSS family neurotransmitter:Na+ symporter